MKRIFLFLFSIVTAISYNATAQNAIVSGQDTLPRFSVINTGSNRNIISWVNNYPLVKQISIQRSFDSLTNFKTILNVADPMAVQNGYMDTKAANDYMFYRIYIQLDKGVYIYSKAKKPFHDTITNKKITASSGRLDTVMENGQWVVIKTDTVIVDNKPVIIKAQPVVIKIDNIHWGDSVATPNPDYKKPKAQAFTPSLYVFTNRDGYVRVNLPDKEKTKKYSVKFFEENNNFLFELKDLKEKDFKLDKTNFYHAGWFYFELYEEDKLLERHKFYLAKDF
jgi:hypothetical protein